MRAWVASQYESALFSRDLVRDYIFCVARKQGDVNQYISTKLA